MIHDAADREERTKRLKTLLADLDAGLDTIARIRGQVERAANLEAVEFGRAASAAFYLARFYTAIEETLLSIVQECNGGAPLGENWHRKLLTQAARAVRS